LAPSVVTNYELAWNRSLAFLGADLRVSVFKGDTSAVVANFGGAIPQPGGAVLLTPANIGKSKAIGLEVAIKGEIGDQWRWGASFTPMQIEDRFAPGFAVTNTYINFEDTVPNRVLNANLGWSRGPWEADGYLRYKSSFAAVTSAGNPNGGDGFIADISSYVSIDARLGYALNDRVAIAIAGQNVANAEQRQTSSPSVERRLLGTVSVSF
jgi:outer membrane receptor protein involved in Fe transport